MSEQLEAARAGFTRRAWEDAYTRLAAVEERTGLDAQDLVRLAESAYLTGRHGAAEDAWSQAHEAFRDRGEVAAAVRCAFWLGLVLLTDLGAQARGGGWMSRAQRLLDDHGPDDCAEHGYLLLPAALAELNDGDPGVAHDLFGEAAAIGTRFEEADVTAIGRLGQGQALIRQGESERGLALLDEVMVGVESGRVSTIAAGLVYCAVIHACQQTFDVARAQQWTISLSGWCAAQPDLVPYRRECLVHRSELAALRGDWATAVAHAQHACDASGDLPGSAAGMAHYQRAELHRLRGEHDDAAAAFARAADHGRDPQPGLALLRLDQGRTDAAAAAIRRVLAQTDSRVPPIVEEASAPRSRADLLAAATEIMLAADDHEAAAAAADELAAIAEDLHTPLVEAAAARARGAVLLAEEQAGAALDALSDARARWGQLDAPYETARTRVLLARALRELGDADTAAIELDAARKVFEDLGATPALGRLEGLEASTSPAAAAGLTPRELQVVRLVAEGRTNREIADALVISDKTVARHLHNVFTKLDLPNRSAATAFAYEHDLV
ncbi:MAG: LuxR C-terminal-related transcriptional regulator [Trueperaceae bacterium]|nr:LuxR C-terminal-related transcriptional regulator [Trueperaceae bacterium]